MATKILKNSRLKGFLLDIHGVLYNNSKDGVGEAIPGSAEAIKR
uniref:HAD family hydrolase n=1 Tax=Syphacia muris TaxID=451379 RepID=A0A0N5ACN3_9BILA